MGLGDPDVRGPVEQPLEGDVGLGPGQGAPAQVWIPWPKAMCWRPFGPVEAELVGMFELPRVAVGGTGKHHDRAAGRDLGVTDRGGHPGQAEGPLDRALEPEHLLDEHRDEVPVVAELLLELGAVGRGSSAPC